MTTALPALGWTCETAIIEDPPNYFVWRKGDKVLRLLDSTNYWKVKLADLGKRLGLPKLEFPPDWNNPEVSDTYCKRDVEILLQSLIKWIAWLQEHDLGGLGISLAQQAWKAYVHRFMDVPIYIDDNIDALELARDAYYGGRVECLTLGTHVKDVHCLDINSMYPYVMREHEYPTKLHGIYSKVKLAELSKWTERYAVVARVVVDCTEPVYPQRTKDSLLFPVGVYETVLSTPEIAHALEHGHIVACSRAAIYDKARIFTRFVDTLYALRQGFEKAGDETAKYYTKIMLNSLYGKFGQRGMHEEVIGACDPTRLYVETEIDLETGIRYRNRHIAGLILSRSLSGESRYSHPAIAAHVTAYARMLLWHLLNVAGIEHCHYMDTDSLHLSQTGRTALDAYIDPSRLGALKVEKLINSAVYYGPKDYELDGVRRIKGVSASAVKTDVSTFSQSQWVSLKGACLADHTGGPLVRRVSKRYSRQYRKGVAAPTGRVSPFVRRVLDRFRPDET